MTLELDLERSLVKVADRWFPAVGLVCPCRTGVERCTEWWPEEAEHTWNHVLGELTLPEVYVPAENGTLFELSPCRRGSDEHRASGCELLEVVWYRGDLTVADSCPPDTGLIPPVLRSWWDAEQAWVVETIDRLGRQPAPVAELPRLNPRDSEMGYSFELGPAPQLVPLSRVQEIWNEYRWKRVKR